jgi:hypothetical protein
MFITSYLPGLITGTVVASTITGAVTEHFVSKRAHARSQRNLAEITEHMVTRHKAELAAVTERVLAQ